MRDRYPGPWIVEELEESICIRTSSGIVLAYLYPCAVQDFTTHVSPKPTWPEARALARAIAGLAITPGA